ncbi:MAG: cytochrome c1 [Paracoccus sp. (in: a-proteobacteria)]|nr:cytochrome c1 [Paracoccus sp. (in: a-proteobacteria)]
MTLRTKTLTAVAALSIGAVAWAQETVTVQPGATPPAAEAGQDARRITVEELAGEQPRADAPAAEAATEEAPAEEAAAAQEPVAEEAAAAEAADEAATDADAEAEATEAAETAAEADAGAEAEETAAEEGAGAAAAEEGAADDAAGAEAEAASEVEAEAEAPAPVEPAPAEDHAADEGGDSHAAPHIDDIAFSFEGPFGKYDQFQLQRGLQVYTEVCSACHGLRYVPIRTLGDAGGPGLPADQVRAYAARMDIDDPETGESRPRLPTDHFPTIPQGDGMGPDLSLMAKARAGFHGPYGTGLSQFFRGIGGPEYIHALLVSYDGEERTQAGATLYHNPAFAGGWISMPAPLSADLVTYEDGTPATVDQMARDVAAFLMWTAEPKMMDRKQSGFVAVIFLIVLASLLYLTNKRLWWKVKHGHHKD